jgi:AcrR family transcriptional regulator
LTPKVPDTYKEEKRAALLQSALACFAQEGYQATTMDDIVRRAGVSKGMVYNYFPSKESMYLQLLEVQTDKFMEEIEGLFENAQSAEEKLRWLLQRFREAPTSVERRRSIAVQLEFVMHCSRHEDLTQVMMGRYRRMLSFLATVVQEGQAAGEFVQDVNPDVVAAVFWALRDGISMHGISATTVEEYENICDMAERMLFSVLLPQNP